MKIETTSSHQPSAVNHKSILSAFALLLLALPPMVYAVVPAPDGGYPGGNTAEGQQALFSLTSGTYNTAVGFLSLRNDTEGQFNTAVGAGALLSNHNISLRNTVEGIINSSQNTAIGAGALLSNTSGANNTATGAFSLLSNTIGTENTATGAGALLDNTTGTRNTADGVNALGNNTTGFQNTATGAFALFSNSAGSFNTASGDNALYSNIDGDTNTAVGGSALSSNTSGDGNTAIGDATLFSNTTGMFNTAIGRSALSSSTTGVGNIAIGVGAGQNIVTGGGNIDIGTTPVSDESNTIRIGDLHTRAFISGISGTAIAGTAVVVSASGQLGVAASSRRFKEEIKPMNSASETILALRPVTFHYMKEIDPGRTSQFGLVAEDVEKANPELVVRDKEGKPLTVRYDAVNAMLLNEFLKEHKRVQELEAIVAQQQRGMEAVAAHLREQDSRIQRVSAQIELGKPAPRLETSDP